MGATVGERVASLEATLVGVKDQIAGVRLIAEESARAVRGGSGEEGMLVRFAVLDNNVTSIHASVEQILRRMDEMHASLRAITGDVSEVVCTAQSCGAVQKRLNVLEEYRERYPSTLWYLYNRPRLAIPVIVVTVILISLLGHVEYAELLGAFLALFGLPAPAIQTILRYFQ